LSCVKSRKETKKKPRRQNFFPGAHKEQGRGRKGFENRSPSPPLIDNDHQGTRGEEEREAEEEKKRGRQA
jgi:hypothetical protein